MEQTKNRSALIWKASVLTLTIIMSCMMLTPRTVFAAENVDESDGKTATAVQEQQDEDDAESDIEEDETGDASNAENGAVPFFSKKTAQNPMMSGKAQKKVLFKAAEVTSLQNGEDGPQLEWNTIDGADGYIVYKLNGDGTWKKAKTVSGGNVTFLEETSEKENGADCQYIVLAYRLQASGKNAVSAKSIAKNDPLSIAHCSWMSTPENISETNKGNGTLISWTEDAGVNDFEISYAKNRLFLNDKRKRVTSNTGKAASFSYLLQGIDTNAYYIRIRAYKQNEQTGETDYSAWEEGPTAEESVQYTNTSWFKNSKSNVIDYRSAAGQKMFGYDTLQGGCTDGRYIYATLWNKSNGHNIKIVKIKISTKKVVKTSPAIAINHGNGLCWNGKYIVASDNDRKGFVLISPSSLRLVKRVNISTDHAICGASEGTMDSIGYFSAIAYSTERKEYVAQIGGRKSLLVMDKNFQPIRYLTENDLGNYVRQSLDTTGDYIIRTISPGTSGSAYNFIALYDWDGNYKGRIMLARGYETEFSCIANNKLYDGYYRSVLTARTSKKKTYNQRLLRSAYIARSTKF